jgi:hypothetical protein
LFCHPETLIRERKAVMQATEIDGAPFGQQAISQEVPALLILAERIAIVGERQRHNAFSHHVGDAAERNAGPGFSATVEDNVRTSLPAIGIGQHLDPSGGVKDTTRALLYERSPGRVGSRIYPDNIHLP